MKLILIFITSFLIVSCNKPKTVLICGDHICINKKEAEINSLNTIKKVEEFDITI